MAKQTIKFTPFDDNSSSIVLDGVEVGHIEREVTVDWTAYDHSTSRCTKSFERVGGYSVTLYDNVPAVGVARGNAADELGTVDTLKGARDAARKILTTAVQS
jgi:hypothetical protein